MCGGGHIIVVTGRIAVLSVARLGAVLQNCTPASLIAVSPVVISAFTRGYVSRHKGYLGQDGAGRRSRDSLEAEHDKRIVIAGLIRCFRFRRIVGCSRIRSLRRTRTLLAFSAAHISVANGDAKSCVSTMSLRSSA